MADTKSIKEIVEQAIIDLVQDGKIEIQDENGLKIDDLSLGINESDDEDEDLEDEEDDSDEEEVKEVEIEFGPDSDKDAGFYVGEEDEFIPMFNIVFPDFETRLKLYLKPTNGSTGILLFLLLLDTALSIFYIVGQFIYVLDGNYVED